MIVIGFAIGVALIAVLLYCVYAAEVEQSKTQFALDTIDALYVGMCQENEELIKRLAYADSDAAQYAAYCAQLEVDNQCYKNWIEDRLYEGHSSADDVLLV